MDTYTPNFRISATRHLLPAFGMGLALTSFGFAQDAAVPAARLRVAQPVEAIPPVARGVYPDAPTGGFAPVPATSAPTFSDRLTRMFSPPATTPDHQNGPLGWGLLPAALATTNSGAPTPAPTQARVSTPQTSAPNHPAQPTMGLPPLIPTSVDRTMDQIKSTLFPPSNSVPPKFDGGWNPFASNPTPAPNAGTSPAPATETPPVTLPAVVNPTTFATPPAYRWYGWGTTVPGSNPYAPGGHSPQGSANWYTQSRATPGAFPSQVVSTPHAENPLAPPVYASQPRPRVEDKPFRAATRLRDLQAPQPVTHPAPAPHPVSQPPEPQTPPAPPAHRPAAPVAMPATQIVQTQMRTPPPPPELLAAPNRNPQLVPIAVSHSSATPQNPSPPQNTEALNWKAAPQLPTPSPRPAPEMVVEKQPVQVGQPLAPPRVEIETHRSEPAPLPVSVTVSPEQVQHLITVACADWVKNVEVRTIGPAKVVVRFTAFSESHAHAAAEAVSRIPELKGFEVGFEAHVANR